MNKSMNNGARDPKDQRYHVEAIRTDGTMTRLFSALAWPEAIRSRDAIRDTEIFAQVRIMADESEGS